MNSAPLIIALIPAYNEETSIATVIREAKMHVSKVIVCDDGSRDGTSEIAKSLGAIVIRHRQNMGYGASLSTLFDEARRLDPDVVVTLDADGQHDPSDIPKLIQPILGNGVDIVIGSRFLSKNGNSRLPPYRKAGIHLITVLSSRISYNRITDAQSGFRAYDKEALNTIKPTEQSMGASTEILIKARQANLRLKEVSIRTSYEGKTSKENPIVHMLEVLASTLKLASERYPRIFYGVPGFLILIVALGFWTPVILNSYGSGQSEVAILFFAMSATLISAVLLSLTTIIRTPQAIKIGLRPQRN